MNKLRILAFIFITAIFSSTAFSQQKMKLAVLDPVVAGEKLTGGLAISVREIVSSSFVNNADNYAIVERSLIDKVMQEAKFSNSDAVDEGQATQLGKLAGADKVVLTVISRFDNRCMMSIKLIDVESATIDRQISKLVDMSSLLDVTEPLTMAVLGKGDDSFIKSTSIEDEKSHKKNLKNLFGLKKEKTESKDEPQTEKSDVNQIVTVPEFTGTGLNYNPLDINVEPQSDELGLENFERIYNNQNFNVIIDLSDTRISGIPLLKFREMKSSTNEKVFGPDFFNQMISETARFVKSLSNETDLSFSYWPEAPITLLVKIREVDEPGRENTSDYVFIDSQTGNTLSGVRIKSKGGRFGSWTNLLGDALEEDAAPNLNKKMNSAKKKYKKLFGK